jgi:CO/xanthine dehydrogenase Mo-binding subunit
LLAAECRAGLRPAVTIWRRPFEAGDADGARRAADVRVGAVYEIASQAHMGLEREAALAYVEPDGDEILTVVGGTHEPHWARGYLARILGLPVERVRVITPPVGGSFGARQDVTPLALAALCAYHVRRPVRLAYTRREVMEAAPKRHAYRVAIELSAWRDEAGGAFPHLTGLVTDMVANTGAHDSGGRYIAEYAVTASGGAYRWEGRSGAVPVSSTPTPPRRGSSGDSARRSLSWRLSAPSMSCASGWR